MYPGPQDDPFLNGSSSPIFLQKRYRRQEFLPFVQSVQLPVLSRRTESWSRQRQGGGGLSRVRGEGRPVCAPILMVTHACWDADVSFVTAPGVSWPSRRAGTWVQWPGPPPPALSFRTTLTAEGREGFSVLPSSPSLLPPSEISWLPP